MTTTEYQNELEKIVSEVMQGGFESAMAGSPLNSDQENEELRNHLYSTARAEAKAAIAAKFQEAEERAVHQFAELLRQGAKQTGSVNIDEGLAVFRKAQLTKPTWNDGKLVNGGIAPNVKPIVTPTTLKDKGSK
jgi:hypothetical protein